MSRALDALLAQRTGQLPTTVDPGRVTREARATRHRVERIVARAGRCLEARDAAGLLALEAELQAELRLVLPTRTLRRTLEPATRLSRRRFGPSRPELASAVDAHRTALGEVERVVPRSLWIPWAVPAGDAGAVRRLLSAAGVPLAEAPAGLRLLGRRLGFRPVRFFLPPIAIYARFVEELLQRVGPAPEPVLSAGGLTFLPRDARPRSAGTLLLESCRRQMHAGPEWFPTRGAGTTVAVIDTGVDLAHPSFQAARREGRLLYRRVRDMGSDGDRDARDGHGTHVLGIACGDPGAEAHRGLASAARQVAIRVFEPGRGYATNQDIIEGLSLAATARADVVNLSLGGPAAADSELGYVCREMVERGLALVVAAAGNSGEARPHGGVESPGNAGGVLAVAALDAGRRIAPFSSRGQPDSSDERQGKPDLAAFGVGVVSARAGTDGFVAFSGTSMATPLVAGFAACLLARMRRTGQRAGVAELRAALLQAATRDGLVGPGGAPFPQEGWNRWIGAGLPEGRRVR
jgi:subtilisin family serine protease